MTDQKISRRDLIQLCGSGLATVYLGSCQSLPKAEKKELASNFLSQFGPIDRLIGDIGLRQFSGDNPQRSHEVLFAKSAFINSHGGLPAPSEFAPLVIVGGGASGLLSAYFLKEHKPIVLEQAPRFGGNSKGESWRGLDYSIGAAYFAPPEEGSGIDLLFKDIGIHGRERIHRGEDPIFIDGQKYESIWQNGTSEQSRPQFQKLAKHFEDIFKAQNGFQYPILPPTSDSERELVNKLDRMSMADYLVRFLKEPPHPHVEHVIDHYFWSATASSYKEVSAAVGLNFFVSDFFQIAITPGGNSAVTEALLKKNLQSIPESHFRSSSLVFDVRVQDKNVLVTYLNPQNQMITIQAKAAIMACPKFIAARLIDNLEEKRRTIIKNIRYRSYLVANVLLDQGLPDSFYEIYFFNKKEMKNKDIKEASRQQGISDIVYGNFPRPSKERTVLTLYRAFPYDGARPEILSEGSYARYRQEFEAQIKEGVLPLFGLTEKNVVDLRLTRWGHPLPLPKPGNIAGSLVDQIQRPFRDRVFFVEQDNWTLPCFESSFFEAHIWAPRVSEILKV